MYKEERYLKYLGSIMLILALTIANAPSAWAQMDQPLPDQAATDPSPYVDYEWEEQEWYDPSDWFEPGEYELETEYTDEWYDDFGTYDYTYDYYGGVVSEYGYDEGLYDYDYYTEDWYEDDWDLW